MITKIDPVYTPPEAPLPAKTFTLTDPWFKEADTLNRTKLQHSREDLSDLIIEHFGFEAASAVTLALEAYCADPINPMLSYIADLRECPECAISNWIEKDDYLCYWCRHA